MWRRHWHWICLPDTSAGGIARSRDHLLFPARRIRELPASTHDTRDVRKVEGICGRAHLEDAYALLTERGEERYIATDRCSRKFHVFFLGFARSGDVHEVEVVVTEIEHANLLSVEGCEHHFTPSGGGGGLPQSRAHVFVIAAAEHAFEATGWERRGAYEAELLDGHLEDAHAQSVERSEYHFVARCCRPRELHHAADGAGDIYEGESAAAHLEDADASSIVGGEHHLRRLGVPS
jgi:hypothetical protein